MEPLQVRLSQAQRRRLAAVARARKLSVSAVVREALDRYLAGAAAATGPGAGRDALFDLVGAAGRLERSTGVSADHHRHLATPHWARPRRPRRG